MDDEVYDGDEPLWRRIATNEFLWVALAALLVLVIAFYLATRPAAPPEDEDPLPRKMFDPDDPKARQYPRRPS